MEGRKYGEASLLGGETDPGCCRGEGALVAEKGKRKWNTQG